MGILAVLAPLPAWAQGGPEHAGGLSLLAPLVAIGLALATRRVLVSLATGAVVGALVAAGGAPVEAARLAVGFLGEALWDLDHLKISGFSVLVGAMVGILSVSGAMRGLVERIQRVATGRRGAMTSSWLAGMVVFFDDYANCLVVGNAMGPLCDRTRVSRAKLAYVVDSTAAPVATLAIVSTWVAFQVDLLDASLAEAGFAYAGFELFVRSLPYAFYSWFTLAFVGMVALTGRDYGPMLAAEQAARSLAPPAEREQGVTSSPASVAVIPIVLLVALTFALMYWTGLQASEPGARVFEVIGAASAYDAMVLGSLAALLVAAGLAVGRGGLSPAALPGAAWTAVKPLLEALAVLYLAWTLGNAIGATGADHYLAGILGERLPAPWLPTLTFVLAALIAFATGTSFGTMTILIPLAIPLALAMTGATTHPVTLGSTAAVLSGAVLGDHASPISDTTILSSLGAGVDLVTHVRTQLPYALTTGTIAVACGYLPAAWGVNPWLLIGVGMVLCFGVLRLVGRRVTEPGAAVTTPS